MTSLSLSKTNLTFINRKLFKVFAAILLLLWIAGFAVLPLFHNSSVIILYPFLNKFYSEVCHQIDYKTLHIFGYKLLVCARCTGIYVGAFFSSVYFIFGKRDFNLNKKLFYAATIILLSDVFFSTVGIYNYSKAISFATGLFFGSIVFVYILTLIDNFLFD